MQVCAKCGSIAESFMWVRPVSGGPRKKVLLCGDTCEVAFRAILESEGLREANDVLGWDVFRPAFREKE